MMDKKDKVMFWSIFIAVSMDILSTIMALSIDGVMERNPIIAELASYGLHFIVLWIPLIMLIGYIAYRMCLYMEVVPAFRAGGILYLFLIINAIAGNLGIYISYIW